MDKSENVRTFAASSHNKKITTMKNKVHFYYLAFTLTYITIISVFVKNPELYVCLSLSTLTVSMFIEEAASKILDKLNQPEKILSLFFEDEHYWYCKPSDPNAFEFVLNGVGRRYTKDSRNWFKIEVLNGEKIESFRETLNKYAPLNKEFEFFT